ncbi:MAG: hypothetical protein K8R88_02440 [Armatimonadetes bacterium]|nr:hypothetical protein [Armatimonadota bacterium]
MKFLKPFLAALAAFVMTGPVIAQTEISAEQPVVGQINVGKKAAVETLGQIMDRESRKPIGSGMRFGSQENDGDLLPPLPLGAGDLGGSESGDPFTNPIRNFTVGNNFVGPVMGEGGISYIPPDTMGAVGPTQVFVTINGRMKLYSKAGVATGFNVSPETFFASVMNAGDNISDPRAWFDRITQRWIICAITIPSAVNNNKLVIGVSSGATLTNTASFAFYGFVQDAILPVGSDSGAFFDYPLMGVDANGIYVGGNMFNSSGFYIDSSMFVIRKSSVLSGGPIVASVFRNVGFTSPMGVNNDDSAATTGYIAGIPATTQLRLRTITNVSTTPILGAALNITIPTVATPGSFPSLGVTTLQLDPGDTRIMDAQIRLNRITGARTMWLSHGSRVTATGAGSAAGDRNGIKFYEVTNLAGTPTLFQKGTMFDAVTDNKFTYGSVSMNGQGHAVVGSSRYNATVGVGVAGSMRLRTDALDSIGVPQVLQASTFGYQVDFGGGRNRWGDYSMTVVDPADDQTFWTFQEYASATNQWSVRCVQIKAPAPAAITTLAPNTIEQGTTGNIVVTGTSASGTEFFDPGAGFANRIAAAFSGSGLTVNSVTFTDPTHVTVNVTASGAAALGLRNLTITNPDGQTSLGSNALTVTGSSNPVPVLTSISPNSATAGGSTFTLTATGSNFVAGSIVRWNGADLTTTFVSSTSLTASVPAGNIATAGTASVTVFNPAPAGGTSGGQTFSINNPAPGLTLLTPNSTVSGEFVPITLVVTGTGFINGSSQIRWNGVVQTTTFISSTQLSASIASSNLQTPGTVPVTVITSGPGGGISPSLPFTITNPVPTLTLLSPNSAVAGSGSFSMTLTGTGFNSNSVVRWNGADLATTFGSSTSLTATVPSGNLASAGTALVTVFNPTPGGGTSAALTFTINNPVPVLSTMAPNNAIVGGAGFTLTMTGSGFVSGSQVMWNGAPLATTFVNSTNLSATVPSANIAATGTASITVFNPTPGGGTSSALTFTINNPIPAIASLSPNSAIAEGPAFTLTVAGSNFVSGSLVQWNGIALATTFVSSTSLTARVPSANITTQGTALVTVFNPTPGGGTSNSMPFAINNPPPFLTSMSPDNAVAGSPDTVVTVTGSNFNSTAVVRWNGIALATTVVSTTSMTAVIPAANLATAGTASVTVFKPSPGGGTSSPLTFTINNPAPTITSISPSSATVGDSAFTMTVTGTGYVSSSVVNWNGSAVTTTFVNTTTLTINVQASVLLSAGTATVSVTNPAPGGGTSSNATFTINNPLPTISTISPNTALAGSADVAVTVTGTNFVAGSVVNWNGLPLATTFVSATELTFTASASLLTTAGTPSVTVVNAAPGGGTSNVATFTITSPDPTVTTVSPSVLHVLSADTVVDVFGTNFEASSVANWNGTARATTFISATHLTMTVLAADMVAIGNFPVSVTNTSGTSNSVNVEVAGVTLTQTVTLSDHMSPDQPVTVEIRNVGSTVPLQTFTPTLVGGSYTIAVNIAPGNYDVAVKGATWLRKVDSTVSFAGFTVTAPAVTLVNGDANDDNVIDLSDYTIVVTAFNAVPSSDNWDVRADLNGDGVVDLTDYTIVVTNFNQIGDN